MVVTFGCCLNIKNYLCLLLKLLLAVRAAAEKMIIQISAGTAGDTARLFVKKKKKDGWNIQTNPRADFCQLLNTCVNMVVAKSASRKSTARASYIWTPGQPCKAMWFAL